MAILLPITLSTAVIARMRAQANFIEYAPLFVLLVLAVELAIGSPAWLWAVALAFLVARVLHAFGMDGPGVTRLRMAGIIGTLTLLCGLALFALFLAAAG